MAQSIAKALCGIAAATTLSGCFFGHLTPQRETTQAQGIPHRAIDPPAGEPPTVVLRVVEAAPEPPAEPAAEALPVRVPPPIEPTVVAAASPRLPTIIRFGTDAYLPGSEFEALLQAHAKQLKADPRLRLLVKGHGDAIGGEHYSQALAAKRAETVAKALRNYGVDAVQLEIVAMADDATGAADTTRRVELIYR